MLKCKKSHGLTYTSLNKNIIIKIIVIMIIILDSIVRIILGKYLNYKQQGCIGLMNKRIDLHEAEDYSCNAMF